MLNFVLIEILKIELKMLYKIKGWKIHIFLTMCIDCIFFLVKITVSISFALSDLMQNIVHRINHLKRKIVPVKAVHRWCSVIILCAFCRSNQQNSIGRARVSQFHTNPMSFKIFCFLFCANLLPVWIYAE